MIPYFTIPNLHLGPLTIEPFGIFAAAGIYLAARLVISYSTKLGLDNGPIIDYAVWGVGAGVVFGHFVHIFAYHPEEISLVRVFKVWDGLSSFGGLLGGIIAAAIFFPTRGVRLHDYGDAFALGVAPGWGVARIGCFIVHDHPGVRTDFPLAVAFPEAKYGGPRHDLGLYDAIALFAFAALLFALHKKGILNRRLLPLLALLYGIQRFFTDFLRASDLSYVDKRYAGLTPAQYLCIGLVIYGVVLLIRGVPPPSEKALAKPAPSEPAANAG